MKRFASTGRKRRCSRTKEAAQVPRRRGDTHSGKRRTSPYSLIKLERAPQGPLVSNLISSHKLHIAARRNCAQRPPLAGFLLLRSRNLRSAGSHRSTRSTGCSGSTRHTGHGGHASHSSSLEISAALDAGLNAGIIYVAALGAANGKGNLSRSKTHACSPIDSNVYRRHA